MLTTPLIKRLYKLLYCCYYYPVQKYIVSLLLASLIYLVVEIYYSHDVNIFWLEGEYTVQGKGRGSSLTTIAMIFGNRSAWLIFCLSPDSVCSPTPPKKQNFLCHVLLPLLSYYFMYQSFQSKFFVELETSAIWSKAKL